MLNDRHIQATQLCGDGNWSSFGRRMVLPFLKDKIIETYGYTDI